MSNANKETTLWERACRFVVDEVLKEYDLNGRTYADFVDAMYDGEVEYKDFKVRDLYEGDLEETLGERMDKMAGMMCRFYRKEAGI